MTDPTDPTGWSFDAIGWLLEEVQRAGGAIPGRYHWKSDTPQNLQAAREARNALAQKISGAFSWEQLHPELTSAARQKNRPDVASRINGQAKRLLTSLQEDARLTHLLAADINMPPGISMSDFMFALTDLQSAAEERAKIPSEGAALISSNTPAQEQLFQELAKVYRDREHGLDADPRQGVIRKNSAERDLIEMEGPFIAFVRCAYALAGKPQLTVAALCKALQRAKIIG